MPGNGPRVWRESKRTFKPDIGRRQSASRTASSRTLARRRRLPRVPARCWSGQRKGGRTPSKTHRSDLRTTRSGNPRRRRGMKSEELERETTNRIHPDLQCPAYGVRHDAAGEKCPSAKTSEREGRAGKTKPPKEQVHHGRAHPRRS